MADTIKLTVRDSIATVVMDRPPVNVGNAVFRPGANRRTFFEKRKPVLKGR
jgi:hypothetical protein